MRRARKQRQQHPRDDYASVAGAHDISETSYVTSASSFAQGCCWHVVQRLSSASRRLLCHVHGPHARTVFQKLSVCSTLHVQCAGSAFSGLGWSSGGRLNADSSALVARAPCFPGRSSAAEHCMGFCLCSVRACGPSEACGTAPWWIWCRRVSAVRLGVLAPLRPKPLRRDFSIGLKLVCRGSGAGLPG